MISRSRSVLFAALIACGPAWAAVAPPQQIVDETIKAMGRELNGHQDHLRANPKELYALVDRVLLPQFDTRYAAQLVLGKHWKTADDTQRQRFIDSFYNFLLHSYSRAVLRFDPNNVKIVAARDEAKDGRAVVETLMHLDDGTSSPVNYSMRLTDGGWKVFDVRIEGVSYVQNYRNQFNEEIAAKGIDAVITRLEKETAAIDSGKEPERPSPSGSSSARK